VIDKPFVRWIVPFLALAAMSSHLILILFYTPLIGIILLYELWEKGVTKSRVFLLAITAILVASAFLVYIFFHEYTFVFQNAQEMYEHLKTRTDLGFSENTLHMTLFASLREHVSNWRVTVTPDYDGNYSVIINIPLLILFVWFWIRCVLQEKRKIMKLFFTLPVLTLAYQSIAFFMFYDFGRWMIIVMTIQFMLVFYFLYVQNSTVLTVGQRIVPFINKNWFVIILVCLLMTCLGPLREIPPSERVMHIITAIKMVVEKLY
jgi:hypothetical protein